MNATEQHPVVSVLMAVHNGERYLREAIESILTQTFTAFEFLIVNDASTDRTAAMLADYAAHDARLRLLTNPHNLGLTKSLNIGLKAAQGDLIARQDADDRSKPYRLAEQVAYMQDHPEVALLSGDLDFIDAQGQPIGRQHRAADPLVAAWYMLFYNRLGGHSQVMFRRQVALALGGYAEDLRYSQDYEFWLRLMGAGQLALQPRAWVEWRQHSENISQGKAHEQEKTSLEVSQAALARLLDEKLALEEIAQLRRFWLEPFPENQAAPAVHHRLKQLYRAFLARHGSAAAGEIRRCTAERFARWARSISLRRDPFAKWRVLRYALIWQVAP